MRAGASTRHHGRRRKRVTLETGRVECGRIPHATPHRGVLATLPSRTSCVTGTTCFAGVGGGEVCAVRGDGAACLAPGWAVYL